MIARKSVERDGYIDRLLTRATEVHAKDKTAKTLGVLFRSLLNIANLSLLGLKLRRVAARKQRRRKLMPSTLCLPP